MVFAGDNFGGLLHGQPSGQPGHCAGREPALGATAAGQPALPVLQPAGAQDHPPPRPPLLLPSGISMQTSKLDLHNVLMNL